MTIGEALDDESDMTEDAFTRIASMVARLSDRAFACAGARTRSVAGAYGMSSVGAQLFEKPMPQERGSRCGLGIVGQEPGLGELVKINRALV